MSQSTLLLVAQALDLLVESPIISSIWVFVVGACVGSFVNVVVYRLPAGMSLVYPPSHCPHCQQPIRARDNLPIIAWFILRGRCRDCGAEISSRYAIVEAVVATVFLLIWLSDVSLLPSIPAATAVRLGEFSLHALLTCTLICAALIDADGKDVPLRLFVPALFALLVGLLGAPFLLHYLQSQQPEMSPLAGMLVGAALGGGLGWLGWQRPTARGSRSVAVAVGLLSGLYLSWFSVSMISILAVLLLSVSRSAGHEFWGRWTLVFTIATPIYLFVDAWIERWLDAPIPMVVRLSVCLTAFLLVFRPMQSLFSRVRGLMGNSV